MIAGLRRSFNAGFTAERYARFLETLNARCHTHVPFRINETPCFFPLSLLQGLAAAGAELIAQLTTAGYQRIADRSVPARYTVPNQPSHPLFVQADFGLVREASGTLAPKLVEIQGFPSLYAFQPVLARSYLDAYSPGELGYVLPPLDAASHASLLRRVIVGRHDPAETVLLEIDPFHQKTLPDFLITQELTGVRPVCITRIEKRGNRLFHDGARIRRIYNRAIVDEIVRRGVTLPFDWRDDLDVEWAGHPNFYFRISKFSIPYLEHPSAPRTWFLHELPEIPAGLENFVLKPLYSFSGLGVIIGPKRADLERVTDPHNWILQERLDFEPILETPHGPTKAEIRVMYIWPDDAPDLSGLQAVCTIVRTGRGKMMGVDHNQGLEWVGASAALYDPAL